MRGLGMFDPPLSLRAATRKPTAVYQFWWEARRDEPGREGTLQHAGQIKLCNSDCNQNRAVILELSSVGHDACQPECVVTSPGPSIRQRRGGGLNRKGVTMDRKGTKGWSAKLGKRQREGR